MENLSIIFSIIYFLFQSNFFHNFCSVILFLIDSMLVYSISKFSVFFSIAFPLLFWFSVVLFLICSIHLPSYLSPPFYFSKTDSLSRMSGLIHKFFSLSFSTFLLNLWSCRNFTFFSCLRVAIICLFLLFFLLDLLLEYTFLCFLFIID